MLLLLMFAVTVLYLYGCDYVVMGTMVALQAPFSQIPVPCRTPERPNAPCSASYYGPYRGRVVDFDTGQPIPEAQIIAQWKKHRRGFSGPGGTNEIEVIEKTFKTITSMDGHFTIPRYPERLTDVIICPPELSILIDGYSYLPKYLEAKKRHFPDWVSGSDWPQKPDYQAFLCGSDQEVWWFKRISEKDRSYIGDRGYSRYD